MYIYTLQTQAWHSFEPDNHYLQVPVSMLPWKIPWIKLVVSIAAKLEHQGIIAATTPKPNVTTMKNTVFGLLLQTTDPKTDPARHLKEPTHCSYRSLIVCYEVKLHSTCFCKILCVSMNNLKQRYLRLQEFTFISLCLFLAYQYLVY